MGENWAEFQFMCRQCMGTGLITPAHSLDGSTPPQVICPSCNGEGYEKWGRVKIKAITDKLDEIIP